MSKTYAPCYNYKESLYWKRYANWVDDIWLVMYFMGITAGLWAGFMWGFNFS